MSSKLDELGYVIGVLFDHLVRRILYFVLNTTQQVNTIFQNTSLYKL